MNRPPMNMSAAAPAGAGIDGGDPVAALLPLVAQRTHNGVQVSDASGRIIWVNDTFTRISGYDLADMVGRRPGEVLQGPDTDRHTVAFMRQCQVEQRGFTAEILNYRKDGQPYWAALDCQPVFDADGQLQQYLCILTEITQRKQSEQFLLRVSNAIDCSGEAIAIADCNGTLLFHNRTMLDLFGSPEEVNARGGPSVLYADPRRGRDIVLGLQAGRSFRGDVPMVDRHGQVRTMALRCDVVQDGDGTIIGLVGVGTDVSRQRTMERRFADERARLRSLLESLSDLVFYKDGAGIYLGCNSAFAEFVGQPAHEIVGTTDFDLFPRDLASFFRTRDAMVMSSGQSLTNEEWVTYPDGRSVLLDTRKAPLRDATGGIDGVVGISRDITHRHEQAQLLQEARGAAELANRAKSEFLANMSHEIRTPMSAVLGFGNLLRTSPDATPEERREWVETICRSGEHLLALINDVLDLSKIEAGRMEYQRTACPTWPLILEVVRSMQIRANERGLKLICDTGVLLPETITTDALRLRQVLTNLLSNAIKFTDAGSVTVRPSLETTADGAAMLRLDVTDTGIGIASEDCGRIFDHFTQADASARRRYGGTGLGLSISLQICEALGGSLRVESEPGRGSTFTARISAGPIEGLRMVGGATLDAPASPVRTAPQGRLSGRVLVVDDVPTNRRLLTLLLTRAGFAVDTADDGESALKRIDEATYALVLMDMQMPGIDGYTAVARMRERGVTTPVCAVTAHALAGDRQRCLDVGCNGYLSKPIDHGELLRVAAELLPAA